MTVGVTADGFVVLNNVAERLLRQVHPAQIQPDGVPHSSVFNPSPAHSSLLSTRREAIGAERAYYEWCTHSKSIGTWGIPIGSVHSADLSAFDDSSAPDTPEGHASIDFRGKSKGSALKAAKKLRDAAHAHGRMYP